MTNKTGVKVKKQWSDWRELADDLVASVNVTQKWLCWINQPLGSVQSDHVGIADVVALYESYNPVARIYEIKISHADFLRDLNAGKYLRYLPECSQMYFAAPRGIIKPEEVPTGTGLILRGDEGWHVSRGAPKHEWKPDSTTLLALLFSLGKSKWQARNCLESDMSHGKAKKNGYINTMVDYDAPLSLSDLKDCDLRRFSKHYGHEIAKKIAEGQEFIGKAEELKKRIETNTGMRFYGSSFESVATQLESHVKALYEKQQNLEDVIALCGIIARMAQGSYNWGDNAELERILGDVHKHQQEIQEKREKLEKEVRHGCKDEG